MKKFVLTLILMPFLFSSCRKENKSIIAGAFHDISICQEQCITNESLLKDLLNCVKLADSIYDEYIDTWPGEESCVVEGPNGELIIDRACAIQLEVERQHQIEKRDSSIKNCESAFFAEIDKIEICRKKCWDDHIGDYQLSKD